MERLRIVVTGFIGLYPTGGVTWDYIQYPLGFQLMGHDVYYIEDTGQYSTYRISERAWDDPYDTIDYLSKVMKAFGLEDRWAYRDTFSKKCYGIPIETVIEICNSADLFINISASSIFREEYLKIPKRILIDSDPMFTQIQTMESKTKVDVRFKVEKININDYTHYFTFGENFGAADCKIPGININWIATRQPICLHYWNVNKNVKPNSFTTIMNWSTRSKITYDNIEWGQKDVEFKKFISLPALYKKARFEVVLSVSADFKQNLNPDLIIQNGWHVLNPSDIIGTTEDYKLFIASSLGEFSVAKQTYVASNSGWFSGRSACYLAMGKPVITQETGWSKFVPAGLGLFSFIDIKSAIIALDEVCTDVDKHSNAAREIAKEYFDSNKVLEALLNQV